METESPAKKHFDSDPCLVFTAVSFSPVVVLIEQLLSCWLVAIKLTWTVTGWRWPGGRNCGQPSGHRDPCLP